VFVSLSFSFSLQGQQGGIFETQDHHGIVKIQRPRKGQQDSRTEQTDSFYFLSLEIVIHLQTYLEFPTTFYSSLVIANV